MIEQWAEVGVIEDFDSQLFIIRDYSQKGAVIMIEQWDEVTINMAIWDQPLFEQRAGFCGFD